MRTMSVHPQKESALFIAVDSTAFPQIWVCTIFNSRPKRGGVGLQNP